jgi:hypothetical protein
MRAITSRVRIMLQRRESRSNFRTGPPGTVGEEEEVTETTGRPLNSKENGRGVTKSTSSRENGRGVQSQLVPKIVDAE